MYLFSLFPFCSNVLYVTLLLQKKSANPQKQMNSQRSLITWGDLKLISWTLLIREY